MSLRKLLPVIILCASAAVVQTNAQSNAPAAASAAGLRFQASNVDAQLDPCSDFYAYACSKWQASHPIPNDQSTWGNFNLLAENNRLVLKGILEKYSADDAKRTPVEKQIGDYYAACMDEPGIEKRGLEPMKGLFDGIEDLKSKQALAKELVPLHRYGVNAFFGFSSTQDFKDASKQYAGVDQGGLGLPDRDYYFKEDEHSKELREQYVAHVAKMFELAGDKPEAAAAEAKAVMAIETGLAKGALDNVSRRDPQKIYHLLNDDDVIKLTPDFDWAGYLKTIGAPSTKNVVVTEPEFFKNLNGVLADNSLADLKTYLRWHLLSAQTDLLPKKFRDEAFDFSGRKLRGAKEQRARWKQCSSAVDGDLGEALGQKYVEETFGADGKDRMLKMVHRIETALQEDITTLPWMTETTRKRALEKLTLIDNKIGYPENYRDYSAIKVSRKDPVGNSFRANEFEFQRELSKIGQPVDKKEWGMTPPTVNAYYNPLMNNINFPAGILQPPFFDKEADDALNFGAIGLVIGHELTHGFDDEGSQFDGNGNLSDWWTKEDKAEFEKRTSCMADQYSEYSATSDTKLNGKLTLGENAADNGGARVAYMALHDSLGGKEAPLVDGMTADQRFFLGFANVWCQNTTEKTARLRAQTDPHSPGKWRVNGTVGNMPEFAQAFHCKADAPMVRKSACRVW